MPRQIIIVLMILVVLAAGVAGYSLRRASSVSQPTSATTGDNSSSVCNCPAVYANEATKPGPPPCYCPIAK